MGDFSGIFNYNITLYSQDKHSMFNTFVGLHKFTVLDYYFIHNPFIINCIGIQMTWSVTDT